MQNRAKFHFDTIYEREPSPAGPYLVYQVGDLSCEPGYTVGDHVQQVHEISFVVSGRGLFYVNGQPTEVREGALFLNAVGDVHRIESSESEPLRYMYLGFLPQEPIGLEAVEQLHGFFSAPPTRVCHGLQEVQECFVRLLSEVILGDPFSRELMGCSIHQLLCLIYRHLCPRSQGGYPLSRGDKIDTQSLVYDIAHYIDAHVGAFETLSQLSATFGYSYAYLAKVFSRHMGQTLRDYYAQRRFGKACAYLRQGMRITDVSQALGYQSIHAFSRAYKKQFGVCPSDFAREAGRAAGS